MRVLLGDDHALVLSGIKALLDRTCQVVGSANNGRLLVDLAFSLRPDLVILDISMPELDGLRAARQIKEILPSTRFIFLSMHTNLLYVEKAFKAGAAGYVLKTGLIDELIQAVNVVMHGDTYLSPGFGFNAQEELQDRLHERTQAEGPLTARQKEILQLIADGRLSKEIAFSLGISIKTVEFHRGRIMARLGVHSVAELVRLTVEQELIPSRAT